VSAVGREERVLQIIETARSKTPRFRDEQLTLAHGAGGKATRALIEGLLVPTLRSRSLEALDDAGAVQVGELGLALTTDSFVVKPLRFPGGSIGELAVNGTVNDLAVAGARPLALGLSLILEEGLGADVLRAEVEAIAGAASAAGVEIVAGDTKVVERGAADGMYVTTSGIGVADPRASMGPDRLAPGDAVLVSGPVGEHGTAIMFARGEFELDAELESDTCSLWPAVDALLEAAGEDVHCMRDATRGGVASVLNELARASRVSVVVHEADVPVSPVVHAAAELLGIDPMYVANEGKLVACVAPQAADEGLAALRSVPGCEQAAVIGEVRGEPPAMVLVETSFWGRRVMDELVGDPLPRIC
jgi:hydrogenase expression/formation protein HypE